MGVDGPRRRDSAPDDLVGRDEDVHLLLEFVRQAAVDGGSLALAGGPGLGKSALLEVAAAAAERAGVRVVRTACAEFLLDLSFATLASLVQPLGSYVGRLDPQQQQLIAGMLGHEPDVVTDHLRRFNAVLDLLRTAAEDRPLLVVIDDLHWADRASATLLSFLARRLSGTRVGLLGALRTEAPSFFARDGIDVHELQPLTEPAAVTLVSTRFPLLGARATRSILAEAEGNPLALLELPQALTASNAREAVPETAAALPLTRRLQAIYAGRVETLPVATRRALLLAALQGGGDIAVVAAADNAFTMADVAPAERSGLVAVDPDGRKLSFRHPLVRSTVVQLASTADRRSAHAALSDVLRSDPVRRAHHLAEAAEGPDEQVAALLEESAQEVLRRGDAIGAFTALLRSADLTVAPEERGRRLAAAAFIGADISGDLRAAAQLLVEARRTDATVRGSLRAAVAAAHVLINVDGNLDMAHRLLAGVLHDTPSPPPGGHVDGCEEALLLLLELCLFAGRPDFWGSCRSLLDRFPEALPPVLHVLAQLLGDPAGVDEHHVQVVEAAVRELPSEADPRVIEQVCTAAWFMDRAGSCRDALWRLVRDGRSGGAVATAISAMTTLASDAYYTGQWEQCEELVEEGLALCDEHGYELLRWSFLFARAMVSAARGQFDVVPALVDEIDAWAAPRGMLAVSAYARQVEVLAALGKGDVDRAFTQAGAVCAPGTLVVGVPQALFLTLDLVVAAVESGRVEQARRHAAVVRSAGISRHAPRLRLLTAASVAVTADDEQAEALYRQALALPGISAWPFDTARVQLLLGEHLHRFHGGDAGRGPLTQAHATLRRLGADPWTARAAAALRAAGSSTAAFTVPVHLTEQELEIARLAAAGLSNRQIGERLYLSHRTIGAHLYRIFPKLGITTRAALRDVLDRAGAAPPGPEAAD
jgi:DNA-binding CsgD family transcriptional regulator